MLNCVICNWLINNLFISLKRYYSTCKKVIFKVKYGLINKKGIQLLEVIKKDDESAENLVRRFNKKVIQSGILATARKKKYFEKPVSKREAREIAIRKRIRKEAKTRELLGIK